MTHTQFKVNEMKYEEIHITDFNPHMKEWLDRASGVWSKYNQVDMTIEESAELMVEISKLSSDIEVPINPLLK